MGRFSGRVARLGLLAILVVSGLAVATPGADAGKHPPAPFFRYFPTAKPPPASTFIPRQFPQGSVQYWGGPVLRTNETFVVFWDPAGQLDQAYRDLVVRYFSDVAADHGDSVYSVLNQYSDSTGTIENSSTFAGSAVDSSPYPSGCPTDADYPTCFTDAQLSDELDLFLDEQGISRPANRGFFVFTPAGVNTCFDDGGDICATTRFCAYHSNAHAAHGDLLYAITPFAARPSCDLGGHPNGSDADPAVNAASHEHREMIDDPFVGDATEYAPPLAWADSETGEETSDKCAYYYGPTTDNGVGPYNQVINGHQYLLQTEWSNALAADDGLGCVMTGSDRPPVAAFTTTVSGSTLVADASGSADPDPGDSLSAFPYFWEFGDGAVARGVSTVRHKYASAGTYPVSLFVTDSAGATDIETRYLKITNPRPAPTHSFLAKYTVNISNSVFGYGNATGLGSSAAASFGIDFDFSDFPRTFTVFVGSGVLVQLADHEQQIYVPYTITLTDLADPPTGFNYRVTGTYVFEGGLGRYRNTGGSGTVTGTCTSSFDRPDADCVLTWKGTISGD